MTDLAVAPSCFSTTRLHLAVYIHASQVLQFIRCEPHSDGRNIQFSFLDPEAKSAQIELEFEQGAQVSARDLFSSQRFLRKQMEQLKGVK